MTAPASTAASARRATHAPLPAVARPASLLRRLIAWHAVWTQRKLLAEMDDTRLADIGLTHDEVAREINRPVWDVPGHWLR